jgi:formate-dependent nitrite reductase membrane component NrfD
MNGQGAWGWKVAAYLFVAGVGAGAYAVGVVAQQLGDAWTAVATVGLPLGPLLVGPATLFLIWDLGRPSGFLRAARRPGSSWISRGVAILSGFLIVSTAHVALTVWPLPVLDARGRLACVVVGGLLAVLTMLYTGLLLGAVRPIPFWSTPILPLLFLVSSLSTGLMAVDLLLGLSLADASGPGVLASLRTADLVLLALESVVIALYLALAHATVAARASVAQLTTGALAPRFWAGVALAGLAVPFALQLVEVIAASGAPAGLAVLSSGLGLLGGLMLRHVVIAAAVKTPLGAAGILFPARARP